MQYREKSFQELINIVGSQLIEEDREEMLQFLEFIKYIGEHHHDQRFNEKFVHFLLKEGIITISNEIYTEMIYKIKNNGKRYCHFFIPELEKFVGEK